MRVLFTQTALDQIQETHAFIGEQNLQAATDWVDRITGRADQLSGFPRSGRRVPEFDDPDILELFEGDWRIIYHINVGAQLIEVLAVVWGKRSLEPENDI